MLAQQLGRVGEVAALAGAVDDKVDGRAIAHQLLGFVDPPVTVRQGGSGFGGGQADGGLPELAGGGDGLRIVWYDGHDQCSYLLAGVD
jgi:hypothetical protein